MTTTTHTDYSPVHDTDGSLMFHEGPSINVDGIDVMIERTDEHGLRIIAGSTYVTIGELEQLRDQLTAICDHVREQS